MKYIWLIILSVVYAGAAWSFSSDNLIRISKITGVVQQPAYRNPPPVARPTTENRPVSRPKEKNTTPAPLSPSITNPKSVQRNLSPNNTPIPTVNDIKNSQIVNRNIVSVPFVNKIVKNGIKDSNDKNIVIKDIHNTSNWRDIIQPLSKLKQKYGIKSDNNNFYTDPESNFRKKASKINANHKRKGRDFFLDTMELESDCLLDEGFSEYQIPIAIDTVNGPDPTQIAGYMVSVAISLAQEQYSLVAKGIPENIKEGLYSSFPNGSDLLNSAKYAVGNVEIALPSIYKTGKKEYLGDDFAVVVGDIIVFKQDPVAANYPIQLWGNELKHVADYESLKSGDPYAYAFAYLSESSSLPNTITNQEGNPSDETSFVLSDGEFYVVQCIFRWAPELAPYSVQYLITNNGNVVANDPTTHESIQIGTVSLPESQSEGYMWEFTTPQNLVFEVLPHGELVELIKSGIDPTGATVNNILRLVGHIKGVSAIPASMK